MHNFIFFLVKMTGFIELLDSNVEEVSVVTIEEERYKDQYQVYYNDRQIKSHLTSLLYNRSKNDLPKQVDVFFSLINQAQHDDNQKAAVTVPKNLHPIIKADQITHYINNDEYIQDKDFEDAEMIKPVHFDTYLEKFNKLNRDTSNPAKATSKKMYAIACPFSSIDPNVHISQDTDALDTKKRKYRLIGENNNYEGDFVNIVGYTTGSDSANQIVVDFDTYFANLASLKKGDKVIIAFNDFAFDEKSKVLETCSGTVKDDNIALDALIKIDGIPTKQLAVNSDKYYIFKNSTDVFSKPLFLDNTKSYKIWLGKKGKLSNIMPSDISQALFVFRHRIHHKEDITNILCEFGFDVNKVPETLRHVYDAIESQKMPPKRVRVTPLTLNDKGSKSHVQLLRNDFQGSTDLEKFANAQHRGDNGYFHIIQQFIKTISERKLKAPALLDKELAVIKNKLSNIPDVKGDDNECRPINQSIAKEYKNVTDLYADDGKECYWDANFDKTDYSLKSKGDVTAIEKHLITLKKYKDMTAKEVENEAKYIAKGRRKVRDGDHAIVRNRSTFVFVRRKIDGVERWIKKATFDACNDDIMSVADVTDNSSCMYDSYSATCKSLQHIKNAKEHVRLKLIVNALEELRSNSGFSYDDALKAFGAALMSKLSRNAPFDTFYKNYKPHAHPHSTEDDMEGNEIEETFGDLMNNLEAQDYNNAPLPILQKKEDKQPVNDDIISIICRFSDIKLPSTTLAYIKIKMQTRPSTESIDKELLLEKERMLANPKLNKQLYQSDIGYRAKVDAKLEEKLTAMFATKYKGHHYHETCYAIALLTCLIMCNYPHTEIGRMIPSCIKRYDAIGYPINSDKNKSLDLYLLCVAKFLSVSSDIRYEQLLEKNDDDNIKAIRDHITEIIDSDYGIYTSLEEFKEIMGTMKKKATFDYDYKLRDSFKPNFKFNNASNNNITVKFLKSINDVIEKAQYSKVAYNKVYSSNSCCPEKLVRDIDYYDQFRKDPTASGLLKKITTAHTNKTHANNATFVPKPGKGRVVSSVQHKTIVQQRPAVHKAKIGTETVDFDNNIDIIDDETFNKVLFPKLDKDFEEIRKNILKGINDVDEAIMFFLRDTIIKGMYDDMISLRNSLHSFAKNKLPLLIGKFINKYNKMQAKDAFYDIMSLVVNNDAYHAALSALPPFPKEVPFYNGADAALAVKNTAVITRSILDYVQSILNIKASFKISCSIVNYIFVSLYDHMQLTLIDIDQMKKNVEVLREAKKVNEMQNYEKDDENRAIQIQYRNMGVQTWQTLFEKFKDIDINAYNNAREENENYKMADYKGENDDDDHDEDTDLVRHQS